MPTSRSASLDSILAELELSLEQLRTDPSGERWLPAEARRLVESSAEARERLREFVECELELWSTLGEVDDLVPSVDPFFTARVLGALPVAQSGPGIAPHHRLMVLGLFYGVAGLLAYLVAAMAPESIARWTEHVHRMIGCGP